METKYVYDRFGQFDSKNIDELKENLDKEIKELSSKFAELVVDKNYDRYQLERYMKNELETAIIFQINSKNFRNKKEKEK